MSLVFCFGPRTEPASWYSSADTQRSGRVAGVPSFTECNPSWRLVELFRCEVRDGVSVRQPPF
jgi:hypothetical protein